MANTLSAEVKEKVRQLFIDCGSIKRVARELKIGKNTVRRLVRSEGLLPANQSRERATALVMTGVPPIHSLDFRMLEKLFSQAGEPAGAKEFEKHIKSMAVEIANEIGVRGRLDITRLEVAVCEYIKYRRFLFCSLNASDKNYAGPFARSHDKVAKAGLAWAVASNNAFDNFNKTLLSLEIKYGKRGPDTAVRQANLFIQQNQQITVGTRK